MHKRWTLAALSWLALIFFSSTSYAGQWCERAYDSVLGTPYGTVHVPGTPEHLLHFLAQKTVHVTLFTVFAMLLWKALPESRWHFALVISIGLVTGICSELLQMLFPGRDPAVRDALINLGGTILGATIMRAGTTPALKPKTE